MACDGTPGCGNKSKKDRYSGGNGTATTPTIASVKAQNVKTSNYVDEMMKLKQEKQGR